MVPVRLFEFVAIAYVNVYVMRSRCTHELKFIFGLLHQKKCATTRMDDPLYLLMQEQITLIVLLVVGAALVVGAGLMVQAGAPVGAALVVPAGVAAGSGVGSAAGGGGRSGASGGGGVKGRGVGG